MYCTKCGMQIPNESEICPNCGCQAKSETQTSQDNLQPRQSVETATVSTTVIPTAETNGSGIAVRKAPNKKLLIGIGAAIIAVIAAIAIVVVVISSANSAEKTLTKYEDSMLNSDFGAALSTTAPVNDKSFKYMCSQEYFDEHNKKWDSIEDYYSYMEDSLSEYYDYDCTIKNADDLYNAYIEAMNQDMLNSNHCLTEYKITDIKEYSAKSAKCKKFVNDKWEPIIDGDALNSNGVSADVAFDKHFYGQKIKGYAVAEVKETYNRDGEEETEKNEVELIKLGNKWYVFLPSI